VLRLPPTLRVALFELEGVLFDLRAARTRALRDGLAGEGVRVDAIDAAALARAAPLPTEAAVRTAIAAAARAGDPAAAACDDVMVALAAHRVERAFDDQLTRGGLALTDGAHAAVDALAARLRLGIVTRLRRTHADQLLAAAALGTAFSVLVAADDRAPTPGAPGVRYGAALARLAPRLAGLAPAQAVALVDTADAATDARAAGLRTVRVCAATWDTRDRAPADDAEGAGDTTRQVGADAHLASLRGLTPATLACALDLAPAPCTPHRP